MKICVAEYGGFCFGVKRAVDTVLACVDEKKTGRVFTWGPITIHNEQVLSMLRERGRRTPSETFPVQTRGIVSSSVLTAQYQRFLTNLPRAAASWSTPPVRTFPAFTASSAKRMKREEMFSSSVRAIIPKSLGSTAGREGMP